MGYHPEIMHQNWLAIKVKEVEAIEQAPTCTQTATASVTFTQPTAATAAPAQPMKTSPTQSQKSTKYCAIFALTGKLCLTEYPIPFKEDWSDDLEEEKDTQGQNKDGDHFSDIIDWDSDLEK